MSDRPCVLFESPQFYSHSSFHSILQLDLSKNFKLQINSVELKPSLDRFYKNLCLLPSLSIPPLRLLTESVPPSIARPPFLRPIAKQFEIPKSFFAGNRERVMKELRKLGSDTILIAYSKPAQIDQNKDIAFYQQDSNFYYLTGIALSDAIAILDPGNPDTKRPPSYTLLITPLSTQPNATFKQRLGRRGIEISEAIEEYGATKVYSMDEAEKVLSDLLQVQPVKNVVFLHADDEAAKQNLIKLAMIQSYTVRKMVPHFLEKGIIDGRALMGRLRIQKQPIEIAAIQGAVDINIEGFFAAMKGIKPRKNMNELNVITLFENRTRELGAQSMSFGTISLSGARAAFYFHTPGNFSVLNDNDLVLLDAGIRFPVKGNATTYAADLTRTWPISGHFSKEQRTIYELVLKAQEAAIYASRLGATFSEIGKVAARVISDGLVDLGIIQMADQSTVSKQKAFQEEKWVPFVFHRDAIISHWVGLEAHDVWEAGGGVSFETPLRPYSIFTIEPGIYIREGSEGVDSKWQGIGVRIEDIFLVSETGKVFNLSARLPKKVEEIEALLSKRY